MGKHAFKILLLALVAALPSSLIKYNSTHIEKKRDRELVQFMCHLVEPRAQIGSTRDIMEFLSSSIAKMDDTRRPKLNVYEGQALLTSPRDQKSESNIHVCSFAGISDVNVSLVFPRQSFFDAEFWTMEIGFASLLLFLWFALAKAIVSSQILLVSTIDNLIRRQVDDEGATPLKDNRLLRLFSLDVPVLVKIKEHIQNQKVIIEQQVKGLADAARFTMIANTTSALAHDLKNPVNVVELALNAESWDDFNAKKPTIKSAILRLRSMIESLKRADLESMVKPDWATIPWEGIIQEIEPIAAERGVTVNLGKVLQEPVQVDLPKLERAIINLIRNAIEAGARSILLIAGKCVSDVSISVYDDGPGVAPDFVSYLFKRGKTHEKDGGSGLGLCFVREVAEGHGGHVSYRRDDVRSIFTIFLAEVVKADRVIEPNDGQDKVASISASGTGLAYSKSKVQADERFALILSDKEREATLTKMVKDKFPEVEITNKVDGAGIIWSDDFDIAGEAMQNGASFQLINEGESTEQLFEVIIDKIRGIIELKVE